jgi:hypothetical protein
VSKNSVAMHPYPGDQRGCLVPLPRLWRDRILPVLGRDQPALDEGQCGIGDLTPAAVDRQRVTPLRHFDKFGDAGIVELMLVGGSGHGPGGGAVLSLSPEMISIGPRPGLCVSTLASDHGLKFAAAAWKSGTPEAGTAKVS